MELQYGHHELATRPALHQQTPWPMEDLTYLELAPSGNARPEMHSLAGVGRPHPISANDPLPDLAVHVLPCISLQRQ